MDKKYQDINLVDHNFRNVKLVIPRGSQILVIHFLENEVSILYKKPEGKYEFEIITYNELEKNKIVID